MARIQPERMTVYALSFIISGTGFLTQMLLSGFWSTAFSDDVYHFSINLAIYLLGMGLGSLLISFSNSHPKEKLMLAAGLTALWAGISISVLKLAVIWFGKVTILPLALSLVGGIIVGTAVPLAVNALTRSSKKALGTIFLIDYSAALLVSLLATWLFLVRLGYGRTAVLVAMATAAFAALAWFIGPGKISNRFTVSGLALLLFTLLAVYPLHQFASTRGKIYLASQTETKLLVSHQSHYQKIVLTVENGRGMFFPNVPVHVLYLDGFVQFSSVDEQNYHACLVNVPLAAAESLGTHVQRALILGGGDGLAARNLLVNPKLESVTLVELDPAMITLATRHPALRQLNLDSLRSPRAHVVVADAFQWVRHSKDRFDLILIDFPHPKNITLSRLFSAEFYSSVFRLLSPGGFVAIQAGPSVHWDDPTLSTLSDVAVSVKRTVESVGVRAHVYASPRDTEAFVMATNDAAFDMKAFTQKVGMVGLEGMGLLCTHNPDWKTREVAVNTLNTLHMSRYMLEWFRKSQTPFFNYSHSRAVFLPD